MYLINLELLIEQKLNLQNLHLIKKIIDINVIYNPSYIYLDRGAGKLFAAYIVCGLRNICSMRN